MTQPESKNWLEIALDKRKKDIEFERELTSLINKHSMESGSGTPDYVLAHYLMSCLQAFERTTELRSNFFGGNAPKPGSTEWPR